MTVQKFGADHAGPAAYDDALKESPRGEDKVMNAIMGLLVVSALAGLVLGFYFGLAALVAALAVSGLILSISAAMILQKEDFDFPEGVGIIFVVLTVNQIAYLVGATLASRDGQ